MFFLEVVSLLDPVTRKRIETPVKGRTCSHLQCFDKQVKEREREKRNTFCGLGGIDCFTFEILFIFFVFEIAFNQHKKTQTKKKNSHISIRTNYQQAGSVLCVKRQ